MRPLVALLLFSGCYASTGAPHQDCPRIMDACNPSDYPPLVAQLPPWPYPSLLVPIPQPPKPYVPPESPGKQFLQKLGK